MLIRLRCSRSCTSVRLPGRSKADNARHERRRVGVGAGVYKERRTALGVTHTTRVAVVSWAYYLIP